MKTIKEQTALLTKKLSLEYSPVSLLLCGEKPAGATGFKKAGSGCIAPLIFSAAKGKTVAFDKDSTGYACSAFYLGYSDWIFNGIEYFLSNTAHPLPGDRICERFVKTPRQAEEYLKSFIPGEKRNGAVVFKPIDKLEDADKPEVVIFFANPDQLSALVFLIQYSHPLDFSRITTGFMSACAAMTTLPLKYAANGEMKAVWGLHDPAVRLSFPENIMSLAMPFEMYKEICGEFEESFLFTERWEKVLDRITEKKK